MKRTGYSGRKTFGLETAVLADTINENIPRQPVFKSPKVKKENQLFKVSTKIPIKQKNGNSTINASPKRRVRSGRVTDAKAKRNILPSGSLNYSRRTLSCIKSNNTARREILDKVVKALNEGKQFKPPTPVKINIPITPRTPGSAKGYLILPEFRKLKMKQESETPCKNINKKRRITRSQPLLLANDSPEKKLNSSEVYEEMLDHCRVYGSEVDLIYKKMKMLDENFENKIKFSPEYKIYEEYIKYEGKKEKLYDEIRHLEEKLKNAVKNKVECGYKIKEFFKQKKELLDEIMKYHKEFESSIQVAVEESKKIGRLTRKEEALQSVSEEKSFEM